MSLQLGRSIEIAEKERDTRRHEGFIADLFRGKANFSIMRFMVPDNFTNSETRRPEETKLLSEFKIFLKQMDPEEIYATDELPPGAIRWLSANGFFALKLPEEYGGKNLSQTSYLKVVGLAASWCSGVTAPISATNTIGLGYPIKNYGTEEQKERFLGIVGLNPTGFSFTEKEAGSDPASMETCAVRKYDSSGELVGYEITGEKWWTTNGPKNSREFLSPLLCVIAKTVDSPEELRDETRPPCFSAFIVPTDEPGVSVVQRCEFEGLKGMYNGVTRFDAVFIPKNQLVGEKEGIGFRIALEALNTGRITVAGSCTAIAKQCLSIGKWWASKRRQWGKPIGQHEAVGSGMLAKDLADAFAMEAMTYFASYCADNNFDCRMEAAASKVFASEKTWRIADNLLQMRGGRGYETARSLDCRGEPPIPVERIHKDCRPNRIFEGSTEILALWMVREGMQEYKERGEVFLEKGKWLNKFKAAIGFGTDLLKLSVPRRLDKVTKIWVDKKLHSHLRFVQKNARKFARSVISSAAKYLSKLPYKQLLFSRLFWIATELYAMSAVCFYASNSHVFGKEFIDLADFYCREARLRIKSQFESLNKNNDEEARKIAKQILDGQYDEWMKKDIVSIIDELRL